MLLGTSLVAQWLRLRVPNAGGTGSILGRGTKIPRATRRGQKLIIIIMLLAHRRLSEMLGGPPLSWVLIDEALLPGAQEETLRVLRPPGAPVRDSLTPGVRGAGGWCAQWRGWDPQSGAETWTKWADGRGCVHSWVPGSR